ncbi:MAG: helix-turn-helix transcriptional regulator [Betaproteobacteria bacterium]|nr:helix-turn-helix transcriptional regulator [Betaproteobacteria bacterium]
MRRLQPIVSWTLSERGVRPLARDFVPLLAAIAAHGSLAAAARALALSYRGAWGLIEAAERETGAKFVVLERGRGARLASAGERLLAADAAVRRLLEAHGAALRVPVREAVHHAAPTTALRVAASHDMALAVLRGAWRAQHGVDVDFHGSAESLALYVRREADVAGFHVLPGDRLLLGMLRATRDVPLRFLRRSQGLILPRGNPRRVRTLADVARKGLRFVNRQPGSGTRLLLDQLLARVGLRPADVDGYANEEFTHAAVAATVAAGKADAGVGLEAAAREFGLAYVPLAEEDYLFVCRRRELRSPDVAAFRALLAAAPTRAAVARLSGYVLDDPGAVRELGRRADGTIALL